MDILPTQINENSIDKQIQIYPNPAIGKIIIDCGDRKELKMQAYNIIGDCVLQCDLTSGSNLIDISSLTSGIYLIRLTEKDGIYQQKLIKN